MDDNYTTYDIPFVPNREFTITSSDGFEENVTSNDSDVQIDKNKNKCKIVESVLNMQNTQME